MLNLSAFDYSLPQELIAKYPLAKRTASRLLCLNRGNGAISHQQISHLPDLLCANDLLIFNDTRVMPARLFGVKLSGGKVEILIERILDDGKVLAHMKGKSLRIGLQLVIANAFNVEIIARRENLFELQFLNSTPVLQLLHDFGAMPLPHYLAREAQSLDNSRYQTVFAKQEGAVAAPTAGLHFDEALLQQLKNRGIDIGFITLHIGAGTFAPVRNENIAEHKMHAEYADVPEMICQKILQCKHRGGKVIAVGTTSVRSLETAAQSGTIKAFSGETNIFIYPGYQFRCVDAILTNFHLPKSTLLMLIAAFAGYDNVMRAYQEAIHQQYRFFSYGDAMLIG